jgi:hypothetical protein
MCKLTEPNKSGDADVDIKQEPEIRPIWVVAKVYGTLQIAAILPVHTYGTK